MCRADAKNPPPFRRCSVGIFYSGKKCGIAGRNIGYAASFSLGISTGTNGVVDHLNALLPIVMCGRYYIAREDSATELQEIIEQLNRRGAEVKTGEIYPTDIVPVLANSKSMVITPFAMKWGYTLPDGKQIESIRSSQT